MDIRAKLLVEHSKKNTELIRDFIGHDEEKLTQLMSFFFSNEHQVSQRAAMVVSAIFDHAPQLVTPYTCQLIDHLIGGTHHIAIKRNSIRILQFIEIPEEKVSVLFDHCLKNVANNDDPVAVKAFSMTVLCNICKRFPELKYEVTPIIEMELERNESAGVLNRGKKVLNVLRRL